MKKIFYVIMCATLVLNNLIVNAEEGIEQGKAKSEIDKILEGIEAKKKSIPTTKKEEAPSSLSPSALPADDLSSSVEKVEEKIEKNEVSNDEEEFEEMNPWDSYGGSDPNKDK